ncbi:MAG TPA: LamG-like jellyroll fold domain-containing protein, partial [Methylomirabilota bacterium]|nr:LamG-like jellyroll fold domain-containing protein [Methylomirabilota bacterium]
MKRLAIGLLLAGITLHRIFGADSVVVFNEVNYHPAIGEATNEWVELHNQMAIDIDLSAWSITGGIGFTFPEGTIISGHGYLVVAKDAAALQASAAITNVFGPFTDRLNNSSATLRLRDRNNRIMDEFEYRDGGKWPVAPDGSGATLAKRDEDSTSSRPEHWTSSVRSGGTPGGPNFPRVAVQRRPLISFNSLWRFEASGADLGTAWRESGFDDSAWAGRNIATLVSYWPFNGNATATRGTSGTLVGGVTVAADRNGVAGGALGFSGASQYVTVPAGGGLNAATAGTVSMWVKWTGTQDADCCSTFGAVLARQANGLFSDNILALNSADPNTARLVWRQSGGPAPVLITSSSAVGTTWHHIAVTFASGGSTLYIDGIAQGTAAGGAMNNNASIALSIGAWAGDGAGFSTSSIDDVAIWDQPLSPAQIAQLAAQSKTPLDFALPETAVYYAGDGQLVTNDELRRTVLPLGPNTHYFRNTFQFADDPAQTELKLDLTLDDGAVFFLNGTEIYRHNMPAGAVNYSTFASSTVGHAPLLTGITLPTTNLVPGANTLAVEVHQAGAGDPGMVFGAGLTANVTFAPPVPPEEFEPGALVFNEISAASTNVFQVELINVSTQNLDVAGYIVARTGLSPDAGYLLPSQSIGPGQFLVLNQATLGFGAVPGDKLFLLRPDRPGVADALEVHERARGRSRDGTGGWLTPFAITPGASNSFTLHNEIVINEIMYHAPPTLEVPSVIGTNTIITFSNVWRYEQSGTDLGTTWRAPGYDDSAWLVGNGLFYNTAANLPAPKNTLLALGPNTHYFRTTFVYTGTPAIFSMSLRHIVDDGVVLYLNGAEISRFNLPGTITY